MEPKKKVKDIMSEVSPNGINITGFIRLKIGE